MAQSEEGERTADVTVRDEQLFARASQARLRAVLDKAPQGVLICTPDEMLYVNHALATIHGYSDAQEFRKTGSYAPHIHPDDRAMVTGRGKARMSNQHAPQQYEFRFLRRDGSSGWMECNATSATWNGLPTSLSWLTDISARKHADEALRRSERLFSKVFHENPDIVTLSTLEEGRFIDVNKTFLRLSGRRREDVVGRTVFELGIWIDPALRKRAFEKSRHESGAPQVISLKLSEGGEARDYSVSAEIFTFEDKELLLTVCHDVTEQRQEEKRRWRAQKLEALGTLAGGIAHDLNNTLVPIQALTKLTAKHVAHGSKEHRNLMTIATASERARDLVKRILAFSREEDEAKITAIDVAAVLSEALEFLRASVPATIRFDVTIGRVAPIWGHAGHLHQVVMNLVTNAAQAIGAAMGTISVSLDAKSTAASDESSARQWICLSVADTGCGMDEATIARIFDPFFTTKHVGEGTGLGLSVVHGIVARHGGHIDVSSAVGRGSTFDLYFPVSDAAEPLANRRGAPERDAEV